MFGFELKVIRIFDSCFFLSQIDSYVISSEKFGKISLNIEVLTVAYTAFVDGVVVVIPVAHYIVACILVNIFCRKRIHLYHHRRVLFIQIHTNTCFIVDFFFLIRIKNKNALATWIDKFAAHN